MQGINDDDARRPSATTERHLRIDNVLATQPEAGPVIPDGKYGWIILVASFYIKNVICGLPLAYGLLLMFSSIETGTNRTGIYNLWSYRIVSTPLLYIAVQSLSEPVCNHIIRTSKWPRFVGLVGVCLVCASILMLWLSLVDGFAPGALCVFSGIFAGFGSSLILIQIETSITQYFRLKLPAVQSVLRFAEYTGIIYTGIVMGKYLSVNGISQTLIWYHLVVLISGMFVLAFKKPDYLKGQQVYRVIGHNHTEDDEEDIFSKNKVTELQPRQHTTSISLPQIPEEDLPSSATTTSVIIEPQNNRMNWETFEDDADRNKQPNKNKEDDEDQDDLPTPRELFTEGQINNNVTYSFESSVNVTHQNGDDLTNIFLPVSKGGVSHDYLTSLTFYNNCLLQVSITSGMFVFFTLIPSHLYYTLSFLHRDSIGHVIVIIFIAATFEALFIGCWKFSKTNRGFPIAVFLWLSATGNFFISDWHKEVFLVIGGILVTTSNCALQFLVKSVIVNTGKYRMEYAALRVLCAIVFLLFFVIDPTYENCFRIIGLLQFSSGSINFCCFVYNKISRVY